MDRILYMCFGNPYTEGMSYKENYLIRASIAKKREVLIVAPTQKYEENQITTIEETDTVVAENVRLVRLNYDHVVSNFLSEKVRKSNRFFNIVKSFSPDVIFYNTIQVFNILDAKRIKKVFPNIKIYADVSTSYCNSANNFLSKNILHRIIYKAWIQRSISYIDKVFYVAEASKTFLTEMYGISSDKLEFSPLCSRIFTREERAEKAKRFYEEYALTPEKMIFSHTGKMNSKKKTVELLKLFSERNEPNWRLFIAGAFDVSIAEEARDLIASDDRITYLGFLNAEALTDLLCATDLYLQPLSPSQTAQTAMGCLTPVLLANIPEYVGFEESGSIYINDVKDISDVFSKISCGKIDLNTISMITEIFARKYLDYAKTEERLFQG